MAKVIVKSKVKKVKRKFPVEVRAPEFLNSYVLGRSEVSDLTTMIGKGAKVNLMYITGNAKNQNIRLGFRINDVKSGLATTEVISYEQIPYYLGRFVKKGSDLLEDSFTAKTKDEKVLKVKPFVVTKMNTSAVILSQMRKRTREVLEEEMKKETADEFINGVIQGRVQTHLRNELKKLFPLKACEFRKIELIQLK